MKWHVVVGVSAAALIQMHTAQVDACGIHFVHVGQVGKPHKPPVTASKTPRDVLDAGGAGDHRQPPVDFKRGRPRLPPPTTTEPPPVAMTVPPPAAIVEIPELNDEVYFGLGSARVGSKRSLDQDVKWLTTNAGASVVVEGFTDPSGSHDANMALGQQRAEAVRDYFVTSGISTDCIEVHSLGDTVLKYDRTDGRNRRATVAPKQH